MKPSRLSALFLVLVFLVSACNMPSSQSPTQNSPNLVFTAAAQTVEAQLTQNALLVAATQAPSTPLPTATDAPASAPSSTITPIPFSQSTEALAGTVSPSVVCDAARFVTDVTVPDGTQYSPGDAFTKTWRLKNTGSCTWNSSYAVIFDTGEAMGGPTSFPLPASVAPDQEIDISISLTAPAKPGTYRGYWRLRNPSGEMLPIEKGYNTKSFFVEIQVKDNTADSGGGKFAVTSVAFNTEHSGTCAAGKYTVTATITVNKAGDVTYTWIRSDGATGAANSGSLEFDKAGSQSIKFEWTTGATGLWVDLYIDNPNHQQFGRATLNCP